MNKQENKGWLPLVIIADTWVSKKPCYVKKIYMVPNMAAVDYAMFYNGSSALYAWGLMVVTDTNTPADIDFPEPLYFDRGLYVDVTVNINMILVQFKEAEQ